MAEIAVDSRSAEKQRIIKRVVWGFVVLVNAYAGGCVTAETGPFESLRLMAVNPLDILGFLMNGPVLIVLFVSVGVRLMKKSWLNLETVMIWSTLINFVLVGLSGFSGT